MCIIYDFANILLLGNVPMYFIVVCYYNNVCVFILFQVSRCFIIKRVHLLFTCTYFYVKVCVCVYTSVNN